MTHITFNPDVVDWTSFLATQQVGKGEMQYFVGTPYQRGAGLLKSVARFLMPVASNLLKTVSREGLTAGNRVLEDLSHGKALKESIQEHAKQGMENLAEKLKQCGKGPVRNPSTIKNKKGMKRGGVNSTLPGPVRSKRQIIDQLTFAP